MGKSGVFEPTISGYIPFYYHNDAQYTIIVLYLKIIVQMGGGRWPSERNKMRKMEYLPQCMYHK